MLRLSSRNTLDVQQILIIDISYSGPVFSRLCLALCVLAYLIHEFNTYILIIFRGNGDRDKNLSFYGSYEETINK